MMPKMDGYQFSKKIRSDEKTSHIPIIMLTAKAALDDKIEGLETGADDYLTKPFSARELKVRVKNLIYQRKELRKRFSKIATINPTEVSTISIDQVFLEKTMKIIESNFEDENFSVDLLAQQMNMSISQLNRKLNALIDQAPGHLIRTLSFATCSRSFKTIMLELLQRFVIKLDLMTRHIFLVPSRSSLVFLPQTIKKTLIIKVIAKNQNVRFFST